VETADTTGKTLCEGEHDVDEPVYAIALAPQSDDRGQTLRWFPACSGHLDGWWDGGDDNEFVDFIPLTTVPDEVSALYEISWSNNRAHHTLMSTAERIVNSWPASVRRPRTAEELARTDLQGVVYQWLVDDTIAPGAALG
jgi:hypothetical protein